MLKCVQFCTIICIFGRKSLSCEIMQEKWHVLQDIGGFLTKILQDDALSCKIMADYCKILHDKLFPRLALIQSQHLDLQNFPSSQINLTHRYST